MLLNVQRTSGCVSWLSHLAKFSASISFKALSTAAGKNSRTDCPFTFINLSSAQQNYFLLLASVSYVPSLPTFQQMTSIP